MQSARDKKRPDFRKRLVITIRYIVIILLFGSPNSPSAESLIAGDIQSTDTPWHINASQITYNKETNIYTATGEVKIYKDDKSLSAESIVFNQDTMEAVSQKNVLLTVGEDSLFGDEIHINLNTGLGTIFNGQLYIEKKHFYIKGDKIVKTGENTYTVNQGSLTACDGEVPDWQITGKELNVTLEGYGSVSHAALWAKKMPVLYFPYFIFPVKLKRQSGLLPPQIGYSDKNGLEYIQPYFWAINEYSDSTIYYHHLQERGEKIGFEYRYIIEPQSKGTFMADSLNDRRIDDGTGDSSKKWGFSGDKELRKNSDRYWVRMKLDQECPYQFKAKLDLDVVSDQDYLREFSDGYTGYDDTKTYYDREFGRDLDDENDPVRENRLTLSRYWSQFSFNTEVKWYDDVIKRRTKDTDETLQQLPSVMFSALKQPVPGNLLFVDMESEYKNFYRKDGDTGQRIDVHPRIYLPMRFQNYFTFEPSAGYRQTAWYIDRESNGLSGGETNNYEHRELYDLKADLTTDVFAVFDMPNSPVTKIKHTIIPKLEYSYVPDTAQPVTSGFDDIDQIDPENLMTFSITNLLISKYQGTAPASETSYLNDSETPYGYNQFFRFKIEQSYDFNQENEPGKKPFYPLYAELDLTPEELLTVHAESEWSHDLGKFISYNAYCKLQNTLKEHLLIEYRYTVDATQSLSVDFNKAVTQHIRLFGNYERNLIRDKDIEKGFGCLYQAQCWTLEVSFKDEENDQKIAAMVKLHGLGEIGNRL